MVLLCSILALPHYQRLWTFFTSNQAVEPGPIDLPIQNKKLRITSNVFKALFLFAIIVGPLSVYFSHKEANKAQKKAIYTYKITEFKRNGKSDTSLKRWKYVRFSKEKNLRAYTLTDKKLYFKVQAQPEKKQIHFKVIEAHKEELKIIDKGSFSYALNDKELSFKGHLGKDQIFIKATKIKRMDFPLMKRGFHWVNEYPNNH
jgi:hypothetical protein